VHKAVKSASSSQEQKLVILNQPKKEILQSLNGNIDSHSHKSNLSSKKSFWGSQDISSGTENLFELIGLNEKFQSFYHLHEPI
jgi:hypothetical protein